MRFSKSLVIFYLSICSKVEISWEPPKGGFTKYVLALDPNVTTMYTVTNTMRLQNGIMNPNFYVNGFINSSVEFQQLTITKEYTERELSSLITEYKIRKGPSTSNTC